jgi:hypothetical protein
MAGRPMSAAQLIARAAACLLCGREHEPRIVGHLRWTYASPDDGHPYLPVMDAEVVAKLRGLAARMP